MVKRNLSGIICCLFSFIYGIYGQQITSSGIQIDTLYYSDSSQVLVYVFNAPPVGTITGSLTATGASDAVAYDFSWAQLNNSSFIFVDFYSSTGNSSSVNSLEDGTYRVIIEDTSGVADTLYALVFINEFAIEIVNKNEEGQIPRSDRNCYRFIIDAEAYLDSLVYYDIYDNSRKVLFSSVDIIEWTTLTEDDEYPGIKDKSLDINEHGSLVEDAEFQLYVKDKYGSERRDTIFYEPIMIRAKFDTMPVFVTDLEPTEFYKNYYSTEGQYSAPQDIYFFNRSSSKVDTVFWRFGDDSVARNIDTVLHTYLWPNEYEPWLIVTNKYGCVDSTSMDFKIELPSAEFEMPNIFVIGDGTVFGKSVFRSYDVSVTYIEIIIFNRFGQKMHEFKGNIRDWYGWDGTIRGSNRYVKSGVYYYLINSLDGWDQYNSTEKKINEKSFPKTTTSGFVHVYNYE